MNENPNDMNVSPHMDNFAEFTSMMDSLAGQALREAIKAAILDEDGDKETREAMLKNILDSLDVYEKLIKQGMIVRLKAKFQHALDEEDAI